MGSFGMIDAQDHDNADIVSPIKEPRLIGDRNTWRLRLLSVLSNKLIYKSLSSFKIALQVGQGMIFTNCNSRKSKLNEVALVSSRTINFLGSRSVKSVPWVTEHRTLVTRERHIVTTSICMNLPVSIFSTTIEPHYNVRRQYWTNRSMEETSLDCPLGYPNEYQSA